jgi:hypothetical protein
MRTGEQILSELSNPGRKLVFVDETGTYGTTLRDIGSNFEVMCGIIVPSERYLNVKTTLQKSLARIGFGVKEFHATEIVNPTSKSAWKSISSEKRLIAFTEIVDALVEFAEQVFHLPLKEKQYCNQLQPKILERGGDSLNREATLRKAFFGGLIRQLRRSNMEAAIIIDSKKALRDAIKIRELRDPTGFYLGSVIEVDSSEEEGLQLADLAAYLINRIYRVRERLTAGKFNDFDEIVENGYSQIRPILKSVLAT